MRRRRSVEPIPVAEDVSLPGSTRIPERRRNGKLTFAATKESQLLVGADMRRRGSVEWIPVAEDVSLPGSTRIPERRRNGKLTFAATKERAGRGCGWEAMLSGWC
jgi:hypothetical protein